MKGRLATKAQEKRMDNLRDIAIFAIEPTEGRTALNELASYKEWAIPRFIEIANSFKTDLEVRLVAKQLIEKLKKG
jgi:hypothetical protein